MTSVVALGGLLALGACSSSDGTDDGAGASGTTGTNAGGTGGGSATTTMSGGPGSGTGASGAGGPSCDTPNPPHGGNEFVPGSVTGRVLDQDGNPAANIRVQLCGTDICLVDATAGADGTVNMNGGDETAIDPAFKYGKGGKSFAKFAAPMGGPDVAYGDVNVIAMPQAGVALAAGDITSNGVTLSLEANPDLSFPLELEDDDRPFRAEVVSLTANPSLNFAAVDPTLNLEMIVATTPQDTLLCPGAMLSFPNVEQWFDGASVDVFLHGTRTFRHYAPYGEWVEIATATVVGDRVVLDAPIEVLGVFGARIGE
ncbi:MAG: hypothetical protein AAF928_14780 [Myxococcota bacterium]